MRGIPAAFQKGDLHPSQTLPSLRKSTDTVGQSSPSRTTPCFVSVLSLPVLILVAQLAFDPCLTFPFYHLAYLLNHPTPVTGTALHRTVRIPGLVFHVSAELRLFHFHIFLLYPTNPILRTLSYPSAE